MCTGRVGTILTEISGRMKARCSQQGEAALGGNLDLLFYAWQMISQAWPLLYHF
jgi:hypothetical protein